MNIGSYVLGVATCGIRDAEAHPGAIQGGEWGRGAASGEARRVQRSAGRGVGRPVPGDGLVRVLALNSEPAGLGDVLGTAGSSDVDVDAHGFGCSERLEVFFRGVREVMSLIDVDGALAENVFSGDLDDGGYGREELVPIPWEGELKCGPVLSELDGCWGLSCDVGCW